MAKQTIIVKITTPDEGFGDCHPDIILSDFMDNPHAFDAEIVGDAEKDRRVLIDVAGSIDWDQQDASRFYIGEDAAEAVLVRLGFDPNEGQCNEAVELFLKTLQSSRDNK